jgi:DNA-binding LacI/PurR family transcriptional regulator
LCSGCSAAGHEDFQNRISVCALTSISTRSAVIRQTLRELGYAEGQNLIVEYQYSDGKLDRAAELAAKLLSSRIDVVIVAGGDVWIRAVRNATKRFYRYGGRRP